MDINNDGNIDLISGNYAQVTDEEKFEATKDRTLIHGDVYVFYGMADGSFEKGEVLLNRSGKSVTKVLPHKPSGPNVKNIKDVILPYAIDPHMVDWDLDGDLDLLLGWMQGTIAFVENLGDAHTPSFSDELVTIEAGGTVFKTELLSGPFVVDFDSDGKRDLLVSCYSGDVFFLKNIGEDAAPKFAAAEKIITGVGKELLSKRISNRIRTLDYPAKCARINATDYNGDGKVDIIFGDTAVTKVYKEGLSDERKWEIADAMSRANTLTDRMISGRKSGELSKEELEEMQEQLGKLYESTRADTEYRSYGQLWLFIRK